MSEDKGSFDPRIHVPGVWRCAKCQFRLIQSNLNARDGSVTARDEAGEPCPNCAVPLWRVTWREEAEDCLRNEEQVWERGLEAGKRYGEERAIGAWLPIVLCPTDGVWRLVKLPDDSEVVASFDGRGLGPTSRQWRTKTFGYHNPSRPSGEVYGGVEQMVAAYDTFVIGMLPEGVYPTHFRPNDTVHGAPSTGGPDGR